MSSKAAPAAAPEAVPNQRRTTFPGLEYVCNMRSLSDKKSRLIYVLDKSWHREIDHHAKRFMICFIALQPQLILCQEPCVSVTENCLSFSLDWRSKTSFADKPNCSKKPCNLHVPVVPDAPRTPLSSPYSLYFGEGRVPSANPILKKTSQTETAAIN